MVLLSSMMSVYADDKGTPASGIDAMEDSISAIVIVDPIPSSIVEKYGYVQNPLAEPIEIEPVDVEPADWKLIGSFCDFNPEKAVSLQPQGDGSYMLTLSELEGSFGFITGDVWDDSKLGNGNLRGKLNGNIDIDLNETGNYIETEGKLTDVKLLLYPYAGVLRVMGLDKDHDSGISFDNPATVYLRGDVNDWEAPDEYKMTYEGEGRYSLKVKQLYGSFKFSDSNWAVVNIGAKQVSQIVGNCTVVYNDDVNSGVFNAPVALSNVEIILDMERRTLAFSGLPNNQAIPEYDPNVTEYGHFILDADELNKLGMVYTEEYDLMNFGIVLRHVEAGKQFYISSAVITPGMPTSWMHRAIMKYLYSADDSERILSDGAIVSLHYPAESMNSGLFEVENDGDYRLTFNLDAQTVTVEETEQGIYICGNVWSENGVYNGFLTPSFSNKEVYDREFSLPKVGDVYQGRFRLESQNDGIYDLPSFRFFTYLAGWINDYCLGSNESDFYCLPVDLIDTATLPIVEKGLGNWGINSPGEWVIFSVDLKNMTVTFQTEAAFTGVNEINAENAESQPQWYNMQGIKVDRPTKGIYIKVTGDKREKVVVR